MVKMNALLTNCLIFKIKQNQIIIDSQIHSGQKKALNKTSKNRLKAVDCGGEYRSRTGDLLHAMQAL